MKLKVVHHHVENTDHNPPKMRACDLNSLAGDWKVSEVVEDITCMLCVDIINKFHANKNLETKPQETSEATAS